MTNDELLIREAIAAEADQAADPGAVRAALRGGQAPRRNRTFAVAVAGLAVAAGVAAVAVPLLSSRDEAGPASSQVAGTADTATADTTILLLGTDGSEEPRPDAIMLLKIRADGSLRGLSLPRDTQTDPNAKLNMAYPKAGGGDKGAQATVDTVEKLTGVRAQHYLTVDTTKFADLSNAVGGVEVCLKKAVKDPYSHGDFPAGKQTIAGDKAVAFLRQRLGLPNGDLDRVARHQVFLRALVAKLATTDANALASLASAVRRSVHTDPGLDVLGLAKRLTGQAGLTAATIPIKGQATTTDGIQVMAVDLAKVRQFTAEFIDGTAPAGTGGGDSGGSGGGTPCVH